MAKKTTSLIPVERIERAILLIRGQKVMLDADLALLYGVETGQLVRAVKRNADRFPNDFAFQLTWQEVTDLKCQTGTSSSGWGGRRKLPWAFTEQVVAWRCPPALCGVPAQCGSRQNYKPTFSTSAVPKISFIFSTI